MKNINIIFMLLSILFVFQCSTNNILQTEYKGADGIILGSTDDIANFKFDPYKLNEISVTGDSIIINWSYSGGCRDHELNLIAKDFFGDSSTPKATLLLSHNSNLDPCERYITENYTFNLLPLKYEFIKLFGTENGSISLVLEEKDVTYKF